MAEEWTQVIDKGGTEGLVTTEHGGKGKRVRDYGRPGLGRRGHKPVSRPERHKAKDSSKRDPPKKGQWIQGAVKSSHEGKLRRRAEHTRGGIQRNDDINLARMDEIADKTGDTELKREVTLAKTFRSFNGKPRKKSKVAKRSGGGKTHYGTHSRGHHGGPCDASCRRGKRAHHHRR